MLNTLMLAVGALLSFCPWCRLEVILSVRVGLLLVARLMLENSRGKSRAAFACNSAMLSYAGCNGAEQ